MSDITEFDQRLFEHPMSLKGLGRQNWAVEAVRKQGGTVYFPELSNFMPVKVGKRITVHSHVWVGDEVELPDDMKIQAFCFIPNGVSFGPGVFLGPRVTFTNDRWPPNDIFERTIVGEKVAIGAGAVIRCGITIGKGALIGAGAVVTRNVPPSETWIGNPAKPLIR